MLPSSRPANLNTAKLRKPNISEVNRLLYPVSRESKQTVPRRLTALSFDAVPLVSSCIRSLSVHSLFSVFLNTTSSGPKDSRICPSAVEYLFAPCALHPKPILGSTSTRIHGHDDSRWNPLFQFEVAIEMCPSVLVSLDRTRVRELQLLCPRPERRFTRRCDWQSSPASL